MQAFDIKLKPIGSIVAFSISLVFFAHFKAAAAERIKPEAINLAASASAAHDRGNVSEAIELYKKALALSPGYYDALYNLALIYFQQHDYRNAEKTITGAIAVLPTKSETYTLLGKIHLAKNDALSAKSAFIKAIQLNNQDFSAWVGLADLYSKIGELKQEIGALEAAVKLNPAFAPVQNNLGRAYQLSHDLDRAIIHYKKAVELSPRKAEFHYNLGEAYYEKESYQEALQHLSRAHELSPGFKGLADKLTIVREKLNRSKQATAYHQDAIRKKPTDPDNYLNLADRLYQEKKNQQAIHVLEQGLKIIPGQIALADKLARLYFEMGQYEKAKTNFETLLAANPRDINAIYFIAVCLDRSKRYKEALAFYQKFMDTVDPTFAGDTQRVVLARMDELKPFVKAAK